MPLVKAVKGFNGLPSEGGYVRKGATIEVSDQRRDELMKNGLVQDATEHVKASTPHDNKMLGAERNREANAALLMGDREPATLTNDLPSGASRLSGKRGSRRTSDRPK
jgi:hypothetical protein